MAPKDILVQARGPTAVDPKAKWLRRIIVWLPLLLIGGSIALRPPFVIRPLPGHALPGGDQTLSPAAAFVEPIWAGKVVPTILEKANDLTTILPEIRHDPEAAGQKYGRREATNPYNYMVKGRGKVVELNTESQAGTAIVDLTSGAPAEKVLLQIGPVVRGTALRDATGLVIFNQFTNQLQYADVSKEMNSRALKLAFQGVEPATLQGKVITFYGTFTFDPKSKSPVLITPVKIEVNG